MSLITLLLNLTKIVTALQELFKIVGKNKGVTSVIVMCLVLVSGSCYFLADNWVVKDNRNFIITDSRDIEVLYVDKILDKCGDMTAVTISDISIFQDDGGKYWRGKFRVARACDKRKGGNCKVNLKDSHPILYRGSIVDLANNSYDLFVELGSSVYPKHFHLRDGNNKQSLETISFFPTIQKVLKNLRWYREGTLQDLWVTTILNKNSNVIYVLTILTALPPKEGKCFDHSSKLVKLREFIKINNN
jgi:hypothetical protein